MILHQPQQQLLRPFIKQVHQFTVNPQGLSSMTAVPTGNVFLSLFWGSGGYTTQRPNSTERTASGGIYISGQQFEIAHHWVKEGEVIVIGLELTPNAIHQFFGVPQQEVTGKVLPLEDVWCNKASMLYRQVTHEPDPAKRLSLVEEFLCKRIIAKEWQDNDCISEATSLICLSKGSISVRELATSLRISTRSLERKFLEAVGISPKAYCKVKQFNYAFRQLALSNKHVLDVVSEVGYYDQPHFIKHFRKVFGISPSQFFEEYKSFLYSFRKDNDDCFLDSMSDTLQTVNKLYVF
ncbi:helix-turn-helix transcriptional regulator [Pontibacter pamirensis]|uniref:helix-turn-helix transcriptional regulator n=1 Tax=Pontibacter pamirensis TaxID=2562824 RepID=UPI001389ABE2|nr:helix-turn-helix transcriptional regulator [Pontibacter pamirensis]